jgi:lipoprotein NlpI
MPEDWISKVAGHLLGKVAEAELFAAAKSTDENKEREQFCDAWYYTGMKRLFGGDKKTAADYFRKCLATEHKGSLEYDGAQAELKALE